MLNNLTSLADALRAVSVRAGAKTRSIVCPVASATLSEFTNDIFMDHDRLPPMSTFTIAGDQTVNGHDLAGELVYICAAQFGAGSFYLVGESGLFTVGFASLVVSPEVPDIVLSVTRPDFSGYSIVLKGCEQKSIFLAKGDAFRMQCTLPQGAPAHALDGALSNFTVTRVSTNAGFVHPVIAFS